jgi:hypothetical protein
MAKFVLELAFDRDNAKRLQLRPKHPDHLQSLVALARDPYGYKAADAVSIVSLREWAPILPA